MNKAARFRLVLLTAAVGIACNSQADLLKTRDGGGVSGAGGGGGVGGSAAGGTGGGGASGTGGGGAAGASGDAGTTGGAGTTGDAGTTGSAGTSGGAGDTGGDGGQGIDSPDSGILGIPDGPSSIEDASSLEVGGATWVSRTPSPVPPTVPSRRNYAAMAYDSNRHKMVLYGGSGGDLLNQSLDDTLEWDATTGVWSDVSPPDPFTGAGRYGHCLVFDDRSNSVLMFGGYPQSIQFEAWDGSGRWIETSSPYPYPDGRNDAAVTFDSGRGTVVIFGGVTAANQILDELWEWDPVAGWVNRTPSPRPAAWPSARAEPHALAYDAVRGRSVLFSGNGEPDLWEWDGTAGVWTNRTPSPLPAAWPQALYAHALVYDPARRRTVVIGGLPRGDDPPLDSVWEWDGAAGSWTEHMPGAVLDDWPLPRYGVAAAYDSDRQRIVIVGGVLSGNEDVYSRQTWEWNGDTATFTDRTVAAPWPRAREAFTMAFDTGRGKLVVYGGGIGPESFRDLWEWDGATGTWAERTPRVFPPAWPPYGRISFPFAYDQDRGKFVSFGAFGAYDLYEWDPVSDTWTNRTPSPLPGSWPQPRSSAAMAYDSKRKRIVLALGNDPIYASPIEGGNVQLWELDPEALVWRMATTSVAPRSRDGHAVAYDSRRGSVVLYGGIPGVLGQNLRDVWEWDGGAARWIDRTPSPLPALWPEGHMDHGLAYSAARDRIVVFGGYRSNTDTWEWDGVTGLWQVYRDPSPSAPPSPPIWPSMREGSALTYDSSRGAVVLFGGRFLRDIWEWGRP